MQKLLDFCFERFYFTINVLVFNLGHMKKTEFIKKEVAEIVGLPPRTIQYYTDSWIIKPDVHRGRRRGDHHRYSVRNLFEFALIKKLREFGMAISVIRTIIADYVHNLDHDSLTHFDYEKELLKSKRYLLTYEDGDSLTIDFRHIKVKKSEEIEQVTENEKDDMAIPVVSVEEAADHVVVLVIDLVSLYRQVARRA